MITVVVITLNESHIIGPMLDSLNGLTDDVVVVDSGSIDGTQQICRERGARLIETNWEGFGETKNKGIDAAKYDWILSLDADELLSVELLNNLKQLSFSDNETVFELKFNTFFSNRRLRFGEWGRNEKHVRLFNRKNVRWNSALVHEELIIPTNAKKLVVQGYVKHYTVKNLLDYSSKTTRYAMLNAERYFSEGVKPNRLKLYFGEAFSFAWNYIFRLGFLDGYEGFITAKMTAHYTLLKYARLKELWQQQTSDTEFTGKKMQD